MNLRWTDAGRAALAAAEHAGVAAVRLTHFAIGDGSGAGGEADDARTTLRNERHRAAIAGTPATAGRIALRADLVPDASYSITEAGIFGTAGDPPSASQLLLYWTDSGAAAGAAASGTNLALPAVIEFQNAAAEVAVTVGGNIVFGATDPATESEFGSTRYATAAETGDATVGSRSVTPSGLHAAAGKVLATLLGSDPADGSVYQLKGTADGTLVVELRTQDGTSSAGIAANAAAIVAMGTRVTAVEGKVFSVPAAADVDKTYVIKRASSDNGGGLSVVEAVFRRYVTPGTHRLTVPAGVTRLRLLLVGAGGGGGGGVTIHTESGTLDRCSVYGYDGGGGGASSVSQSGAELAAAAGGRGGRGRRQSGDSIQGAVGWGAMGYGAGGVGGGAPYFNGYRPGGGLAGAVTQRTVAVTPGAELEIVVGSGGSGGSRNIGGSRPCGYDSYSTQSGGTGAAGSNGFVQIVNG